MESIFSPLSLQFTDKGGVWASDTPPSEASLSNTTRSGGSTTPAAVSERPKPQLFQLQPFLSPAIAGRGLCTGSREEESTDQEHLPLQSLWLPGPVSVAWWYP